jgi:hypothetical protein
MEFSTIVGALLFMTVDTEGIPNRRRKRPNAACVQDISDGLNDVGRNRH